MNVLRTHDLQTHTSGLPHVTPVVESLPFKLRLRLAFTLGIGAALGLVGCATTSALPPPPAVTAAAAVPAVVTISGASQVRVGAMVQFTAKVTAGSSSNLIWQVNGVKGGSASTGTISSAGLYTAPSLLPSPNTVTIKVATQIATGTGAGSGSMTVTVLNPIPAVTSATATQSGTSTTYDLVVVGSSFVKGAEIRVGGNAVTTDFVSATELTATLTVSASTTSVTVDVLNPTSGGTASGSVNAVVNHAAASLTSAARLLDQATFGPTLTDIAHVQKVGLDGYISEQFNVAPTLLAKIPAAPTAICTATDLLPCEQSEWWKTVLTGPDQLRQRVAFALSEMFVVSTNSVNPESVVTFQNMLATDAFSNFSKIMKDVALSTAMGGYLNMLNSNKPATGQIANENFPRENMQLFTVGIDLLNEDGSLQLDSKGNPIPVYTEAEVEAFAKAFTGWTYATATGGSAAKFPNGTANYDAPMAAVESAHDTTSKTLLNGKVLPAGQTADADLTDALENVFAHPNVGPFVCRQLIQHLVASDPSAAYVRRVATVFADNGKGVRGDMEAVVRAILEDPDARAADTSASFDGGHLREAMLYMTDLLRGLGFTNNSSVGDYSSLSNYTNPLGEKPYSSGSVFNFFPPNYVIPGTKMNAPEFDQENTASAILRLTLADNVVYNRISNFTGDLTATSALGIMASRTGVAAADAGDLADALGVIFLHGQMPSEMRTDIVNHVAAITNIAERVRVATYLVITSSQYKIEY